MKITKIHTGRSHPTGAILEDYYTVLHIESESLAILLREKKDCSERRLQENPQLGTCCPVCLNCHDGSTESNMFIFLLGEFIKNRLGVEHVSLYYNDKTWRGKNCEQYFVA